MKLSLEVFAKMLVSPGGVLFGCLCLYWFIQGWPYGESTASWAQFFGSVIGLGIAIAVPAWQKGVEAAAAKEAEFRARKIGYHAFWALLEECRTVTNHLHKFVWYDGTFAAEKTFTKRHTVALLKGFSDQMACISIDAFGFDVAPSVLKLKSQATFLRCIADELEGECDLGTIRGGLIGSDGVLDGIDKDISALNDWLHDVHGQPWVGEPDAN